MFAEWLLQVCTLNSHYQWIEWVHFSQQNTEGIRDVSVLLSYWTNTNVWEISRKQSLSLESSEG